MGSISILILVFSCRLIVILVLYIATNFSSRFHRLHQAFVSALVLSELFDLFIEAHFELLVTGWITLRLSSFKIALTSISKPGLEVFMYLFGAAGLGLSCVLAPLGFLYVFNQSNNRLRSKEFKRHWHPYYSEVRFTDAWARLYIFFFMMRRIFILCIFAYVDHPAFQVISIQFLNMFMMIYQGKINPLEEDTLNRYELINEYFVLTGSYATFFWVSTTDYELVGCAEGVERSKDAILRFIPHDIVNNDWIANGVINLILILIAVNLAYFAYLAGNHTKLVIVKYWRLIPWTIDRWIYGAPIDQSKHSQLAFARDYLKKLSKPQDIEQKSLLT